MGCCITKIIIIPKSEAMTSNQLFQLERYGDVLPETLPFVDPNEEMLARENDYRLSGAELQAEVISQEIYFVNQ